MNRREAIAATTAGILGAVGGTLPAAKGSQNLQRRQMNLRDYRTWPGYEEGTKQVPVRDENGQMTWVGMLTC